MTSSYEGGDQFADLHGRVIATPHMEVPMTSEIRVFLGTLAVSVIYVAVVVPLCMPRR